MPTWLEIACVLGPVVVMVLAIASPSLWRRAVARRGIWLLDNRPKPHQCRQPSRPRRGTLGWRCADCGTLYRARGISNYGDTVWIWDEVDEATGTTANDRTRAEIAARRQVPALEAAKLDLSRYWTGPDSGTVGFVIKRFVQGAFGEVEAVGYLEKLLSSTNTQADQELIYAAIEGVHRLETARRTVVTTRRALSPAEFIETEGWKRI
ncbi:MAG TPA: hypothetical protein VGH72_33750 [Pseudonocardia sp.]|jgi:hypothetical protein